MHHSYNEQNIVVRYSNVFLWILHRPVLYQGKLLGPMGFLLILSNKKNPHKCIFVYDKVQVNLFLCFLVNVKWGKEKFSDVECNTEEPPMVFKAQLFALSGVQPDRQKIMVKGAVVKVALVTVFL